MAKDEINAFLGPGTSYEGKLQFQGTVRIDGNFQGQIDSDGTLIVGQDAVIDAQIAVDSLIMSGSVQGRIIVATKVHMHKTAHFNGSLATPALVVDEGAVLDGEIMMSRPSECPENGAGTGPGRDRSECQAKINENVLTETLKFARGQLACTKIHIPTPEDRP